MQRQPVQSQQMDLYRPPIHCHHVGRCPHVFRVVRIFWRGTILVQRIVLEDLEIIGQCHLYLSSRWLALDNCPNFWSIMAAIIGAKLATSTSPGPSVVTAPELPSWPWPQFKLSYLPLAARHQLSSCIQVQISGLCFGFRAGLLMPTTQGTCWSFLCVSPKATWARVSLPASIFAMPINSQSFL